MKVKLGGLDYKETLYYPKIVGVWLASERKYEFVGTCEVLRDENGHHFGELYLDKQVRDDLFFYYRNSSNNAGIYVFTGLDLMENELEHAPTKRLKEMIIKQNSN